MNNFSFWIQAIYHGMLILLIFFLTMFIHPTFHGNKRRNFWRMSNITIGMSHSYTSYVQIRFFDDVSRKMKHKIFSTIVMLLNMVDILEPTELQAKFFNLDTIGPPFSKMLKHMLQHAIGANAQVTFHEDMRCP